MMRLTLILVYLPLSCGLLVGRLHVVVRHPPGRATRGIELTQKLPDGDHRLRVIRVRVDGDVQNVQLCLTTRDSGFNRRSALEDVAELVAAATIRSVVDQE